MRKGGDVRVKERMTRQEYALIASMLFGMFFGAGNLIFPVYMGQAAGSALPAASAGFLVTGVGFPLLAVAALGVSRSESLLELSSKVGRRYGVFFTCLLYLTIGPFFAAPRCASVPFTVAILPLVPEGGGAALPQLVFTSIFFAAAAVLSLRPGKILTWIGKVLNPVFLVSLGVLVAASLLSPMGAVRDIAPDAAYAGRAFFQGFLDGYNTMDALAGLAFGIVVVDVIKGLGIRQPEAVARNTVLAGVFSCLLMAVIYVAVAVMGAQSRGAFPLFANGGEALAAIAGHYFGGAGSLILAVIVTFACLKTAVGLITSCAEAFRRMFPGGPAYPAWVLLFTGFSLLVSNVGLTAIIAFSLPMLMFLYPLAITLILLSLGGGLFGESRCVYVSVTAFTFAAALLDLLHALPPGVAGALRLDGLLAFASAWLPLFPLGLGWVCPALAGLAAGLLWKRTRP